MPLLDLLLPAYRDEGKSRVVIAFGCTGGRHRSVAITTAIADLLTRAGQEVAVRHRDMETWERDHNLQHKEPPT